MEEEGFTEKETTKKKLVSPWFVSLKVGHECMDVETPSQQDVKKGRHGHFVSDSSLSTRCIMENFTLSL